MVDLIVVTFVYVEKSEGKLRLLVQPLVVVFAGIPGEGIWLVKDLAQKHLKTGVGWYKTSFRDRYKEKSIMYGRLGRTRRQYQ
ncbi:hypothetical protein A0H81_00634 [Grifola frondosa]|uniref:Uncharacterized protein n=1 Tax=Grifola frondosa TaxID=5627 RepID=A0A1C7MSB0_GRIFR|nr:hypothetical protein A0H81_00634 [Grifola frondosa]